jgi:hypothetical protein
MASRTASQHPRDLTPSVQCGYLIPDCVLPRFFTHPVGIASARNSTQLTSRGGRTLICTSVFRALNSCLFTLDPIWSPDSGHCPARDSDPVGTAQPVGFPPAAKTGSHALVASRTEPLTDGLKLAKCTRRVSLDIHGSSVNWVTSNGLNNLTQNHLGSCSSLTDP